MLPLKRGSVYRYNYLWSREHENQEATGRKVRPACLMVRTTSTPSALFLFPLTSQDPGDRTVALEAPESECRRAGLREPCWIVVNEYNRVGEDELYDFESLVPLGEFSLGFLRRIAGAIAELGKNKRLKGVLR